MSLMARISRIVAVDYPRHVTRRGVRSMDIFHGNQDREPYLQFVKEEALKRGTDILAWCLREKPGPRKANRMN